ncbi:MAG TPA: TraB domain-containing protein [Candidatus Thermoplasmatota archaeon]|nr:TraB domain-containing protein [Candidatus Thermoplasmatota archaeon]
MPGTTAPNPAAAMPDAGATPVPRAPPVPGSPAARPPEGASRPALTLIGAGHVFRIEQAITQAIQALRPDVVFVELDQGRLDALLHRQRTGSMPDARGAGMVQKRLARFQQEVAGLYGADVGGEMLAAVQAGQSVGARIALIDDPADQTLGRALREITLREKLRAVGMLLGNGARALLPGRDAKGEVEAELQRYQDDPTGVMDELRRKFPTIHRVVIRERDERMASRIRAHLAPGTGARHGLAVLGDGHLNGMLPLLADLAPAVYRLPDVREGRLPRGLVATGTTEKVGFTVRYGAA